MTARTQRLMQNTPIKSTQVSQEILAMDARSSRPGMKWELELDRARLLTESYRQTEGEAMVLRRAKALQHILENMNVYIRPEELVVGNFASNPDAVCHYPEFQIKWVERETAKGRVFEDMLDDKQRKELKEIHKYWEDLAIHSVYRKYLPDQLKDLTYVFNYESATPNFEKVLGLGLSGIIIEAQERKSQLENEFLEGSVNGRDYVKKRDFLDATIITLNAAINWGRRYAALAEKLAEAEKDQNRKVELEKIAEICMRVPADSARTLNEAIQSFWFIHLIVNFIELPMVGDGIRFDVCMGPYYKKDLNAGILDRDMAQELVECLFVKSQETGFLHPPIWSGQGGGAIGYQTLNIGGVDCDGNDITNEISFIVLDAIKAIRTVTPPLALRWNENIPEELVNKAIECMASGMPQPAIFNDKINIPRLTDFGVPLKDARNYSINNCMVPTIPGKNFSHRSAWANGIPLPLCLTAALGLGILPGFWRKPLGNPIEKIEKIQSMEEVMEAVIDNCVLIMQQSTHIGNICDALYESLTPRPFLSAVLDGAIEKAQDVREWNYDPDYRDVIFLGLNNLADSLAAIKKVVFDDKKVSLAELIKALKNNWKGFENLRQSCLKAPKFGNDDDYVDLISFEVGKRLKEEAAKIKTYLGNPLYADGTVASAFWMHGMTCLATPDGRKNGDTFHDGSISPMGGKDQNGPTAAIRSVAKVNPLQTFNPLFNQSFMPEYLTGRNAKTFAQYLKTCTDLGLHHIQFSVVDKETLQDAQSHPEDHTNLMVRVCGYSAFFIDLNKGLQDGIISRTSQCL